ncbi:MAG TPA: SdiA-regulated domain-containing protein [Gemmatimonadaceae bacterium]|nr:SdiA-regulated domain-containing protein [Gemmatimonadaceae bacterium]
MAASVLALSPVAGCSAQSADSRFGRYDLDAARARQLALPVSLREVSGLAVAGDGALLAHDDETGAVSVIDPRTGSVRPRWPDAVRDAAGQAQRDAPRGDFEGIAVAEGHVILSTSTGTLLEYAGESGATERSVVTGLGSQCELEGLEYDGATQSLLLPCKQTRGSSLTGRLVIFAVPIATLRPDSLPRVSVPFSSLFGDSVRGDALHPSAIAIDPRSGHLLVLAARERVLLEMTQRGALVRVARLSPHAHPQPEGIAILRDGTLAIADEGAGGRGRITLYPPLARGGGAP